MTKSRRWSNASAPCRLEWAPSRLLVATLVVLGALAAFATIASEMPRAFAIPLSVVAFAYGVWLARKELRKPTRELVIAADGTHATLDGITINMQALQWRGPIAFLRYRDADNRPQRLIWWPDTLDASGRRELRLAAPVQAATPPSLSMAP